MKLFSIKRHSSRGGQVSSEVAELSLRVGAVGLLAAIGWIHLHLWQSGYRGIPTIGNLFIANFVSCFVLGLAMLLWPSRLVAVSGVGLAVGTLGGLVISVEIGLFGFTDTFSAPYAVESLVLEILATAVLVAWLTLDLRSSSAAWVPQRMTGTR